MKLPLSFSDSLAAAAPIRIGRGARVDAITLKPGSMLTVNEFGTDILRRSYSLRSSTARSTRNALKAYIADDVYSQLRLVSFKIVDLEGMESEMECVFKGYLGWSRDTVLSEAMSLQTSRIEFPGGTYYEILHLAPTVAKKWVATSKPKIPANIVPTRNIVIRKAMFYDTEGNASPLPGGLIDDLDDFEEVQLFDFQSTEVVPDTLWECSATWIKRYVSTYIEAVI